MVRTLITIGAVAALLPGLAACGTLNEDRARAGAEEMTAYNEPSLTVPDYSARGATSLVTIGLRIF